MIQLIKKAKDIISKFKDHATLTSSHFASTVINAVFWIFLASFLGPEEYGELGFLFAMAYVGQAVANLGIDRLIIVYGAKKEQILQPAYSLALISISIVSVIFYIVTQNISVSFLIWGMQVMLIFLSELNSKKMYAKYSQQIIIYRILIVVFALSLYQVFDIDGIILGAALASFPAFRWIYNFIKNEKTPISVLRPKLKFMLNNYLSLLTVMIFAWGDKILIGPLFGFSTLGFYTFALQYAYALNAIPISLMVYLLPLEAQKIQKKKLKIYAIIISSLLALLLIVVAPYLVNTFFPNYQDSIFPMQITAIGVIPWVISVIFEASFLGREKSKFVLIATGIQTISYFLLLMILGNEFGIIGFSMAFLISFIVRCVVNTVSYKIFFNKINT